MPSKFLPEPFLPAFLQYKDDYALGDNASVICGSSAPFLLCLLFFFFFLKQFSAFCLGSLLSPFSTFLILEPRFFSSLTPSLLLMSTHRIFLSPIMHGRFLSRKLTSSGESFAFVAVSDFNFFRCLDVAL